MRARHSLPLLLVSTGVFVTAIHDYAYRRVGGDDYEVYGLISHAGSDMLIAVIALTLVAMVWQASQ